MLSSDKSKFEIIVVCALYLLGVSHVMSNQTDQYLLLKLALALNSGYQTSISTRAVLRNAEVGREDVDSHVRRKPR